MKKIKSLLIAIAGLSLSLGAAIGVGLNSEKKQANEASAANELYYRGTLNDWDTATGIYVINSGSSRTYDCVNGGSFKILTSASSWDNTEVTSATGTAIDCHGISFNGKSNSTVNFDSKYVFSNNAGTLYIDIGEFFYTGTDSSWSKLVDADHPAVTVGSTATFNLTKGETFKLFNKDWYLGYSDLMDGDFYGSFSAGDGGNIVCQVAGSYTVSISLVNHSSFNVRIYPAGVNPDNKAYVYVLDLYGNKLGTNHKAYTWIEGGQGMSWPGATMTRYPNTTHMYQQEFWTGMENVIFNNKVDKDDNEGMQTYDWDVSASGEYSKRGKCLILGESTDYGKWSSDTWVSPAVGKYIENCMHFANYNESQSGNGECISESWYTTAKNAYEANDFASYRQELCQLDFVVARLQAWARANSKTFTVGGNGIGTFSSRVGTPSSTVSDSNNSTTLIVVVGISAVSLVAVGGYFFFRKRKEY